MPARLHGVKEDTGAHIEVLLLKQEEGDKWETLVKPAKRVKEGTVISFGEGKLKATCTGTADRGGRQLEFSYDGIFYEILDELGEMPLPPYIKETLDARSLSNSICERNRFSSSANCRTSLYRRVTGEVKTKGVELAFITLHVGLGTFRPVSADTIEEHHMHAEYYHMSEETAALLNRVKRMVDVLLR